MNKMIQNLIAVALILGLVRCSINEPHKGSSPVFQSSAELGWFNNKSVVNINDHRGEQYMIDYKLYRDIYPKQGYNGVVKYYYEHPSDERIYLPSEEFRVSHALDADTMSRSFEQSYTKAIDADTLYFPSAQIISKSLSVRKQRFGSLYNPSTAKPI